MRKYSKKQIKEAIWAYEYFVNRWNLCSADVTIFNVRSFGMDYTYDAKIVRDGEHTERFDDCAIPKEVLHKYIIATRMVEDFKEATTEMCPHCESEQETKFIVSPCPGCGKELVACSMCQEPFKPFPKCGCKDCKSGSNFKLLK
jgi:hypothetical protein